MDRNRTVRFLYAEKHIGVSLLMGLRNMIIRIWLNGVVDETIRDFWPNVCEAL
jgi:hypothetical protein